MSVIKGLSSMATRRILADLAARYRAETGREIAMEATGGVSAARRVRDGENVDIVVLASGVTAELEAEGLFVAGSRMDLARSVIAIAVPAGASAPNIADSAAVRAAITQARTISYSTGPSGDHLQALWRDWGMAELMAGKAKQAPPGVPVASVVARGEADLGFQQLSELMDEPGVRILGPLPADIQQETVFTGAIARTSLDPETARDVLNFFASAETAAVKRRFGMEPAG